MNDALTTSRPLGPDDVAVGDFVTVSHQTFELLPDDTAAFGRDLQPQRIELIPHDAGRPLKVRGLCLPFVLVQDPAGAHSTLDLRRHRLARLDPGFGRDAYRRMQPASGNKIKRKRRDKRKS